MCMCLYLRACVRICMVCIYVRVCVFAWFVCFVCARFNMFEVVCMCVFACVGVYV